MNSLHCTPSSALWVSGIRTKASYSHLNFVPKRRKERRCSHVIIQNATCGLPFFFFFLVAIGQNCNMKIGLYFLFLFTYITYALIFFLLNMKDELTSGMPEHIEVILFACFVLVFGFFFFFFFFFNNQSGIFWYGFKIITEVFQHFTLSNFLSCGNYFSLIFMSPDVLVQIRFSYIFLC